MKEFIFTENGAPYVIYNKDGHHQQGPNGSNGQWGPGPSQNGYPSLVSSQHEPTEQSTEQASQSTIASPLPSPYPNTNHSIQGMYILINKVYVKPSLTVLN
jgi:hypothetical protein